MIYIDVKDELQPVPSTGEWKKTGNRLVEVHTNNPVNGKVNLYRFREIDAGKLDVIIVKKSRGGRTMKISNPDVSDVPRTVREKLIEKGFFLNGK